MRNLRNAVISIVLTMLVGLSIACSRRPNDETIVKDIQNKAATDPDTKDSQVSVAAKDGKVTLRHRPGKASRQRRLLPLRNPSLSLLSYLSGPFLQSERERP